MLRLVAVIDDSAIHVDENARRARPVRARRPEVLRRWARLRMNAPVRLRRRRRQTKRTK